MMINKRLIGTVSESKKYIAGSVAFQWCALAANICMGAAAGRLLEGLYLGTARGRELRPSGTAVPWVPHGWDTCPAGPSWAASGYFTRYIFSLASVPFRPTRRDKHEMLL